jgi:antitoxin (DNA-binding transcriptional repressor) of toxin-antitoxin stability system
VASINLDDLKGHLTEVISALNPGEQLVIVQNGELVATLMRHPPGQWPCRAGSAKDTKHWMAPDFDAPLEDFREYT